MTLNEFLEELECCYEKYKFQIKRDYADVIKKEKEMLVKGETHKVHTWFEPVDFVPFYGMFVHNFRNIIIENAVGYKRAGWFQFNKDAPNKNLCKHYFGMLHLSFLVYLSNLF